jgi:tetratricopeptide (TPR) repeat protein
MAAMRSPQIKALLYCSLFLCSTALYAQNQERSSYSIALPEHSGQLHWDAPGFEISQNSAKTNGHEIGFRGRSLKSHTGYLAFLFLNPEQAPMTSAKCRDGAMQALQKTAKIIHTVETHPSSGPEVTWVSYSAVTKSGITFYNLRGFTAEGDVCGDLEISSDSPIDMESAEIKPIADSYRLDPNYKPVFGDVFQYAQILYNMQSFKAAAPLFEKALAVLNSGSDGKPFPSQRVAQRVATDQAGMAYGMSGDNGKARAIFEHGITTDPDYPMYYYNLACADAGEKKLDEARKDLEQAFAHKANTIQGEKIPDPTKDDSFLPYRDNKDFWQAIEKLNQ